MDARGLRILVLTLLALLLLGGVAFGQEVEVRHYVQPPEMLNDSIGVQEHLMVRQDGVAAKVVIVRNINSGEMSGGAAEGEYFGSETGEVNTFCFIINKVEGSAPVEMIGSSFCYLYDNENDVFVPLNGEARPGVPMVDCGEPHTMTPARPAPILRST